MEESSPALKQKTKLCESCYTKFSIACESQHKENR